MARCPTRADYRVSLFSGTRLTDRDIDRQIHGRVQKIVHGLWEGRIDPPDACRQLVELIVRASDARTRHHRRAEKE